MDNETFQLSTPLMTSSLAFGQECGIKVTPQCSPELPLSQSSNLLSSMMDAGSVTTISKTGFGVLFLELNHGTRHHESPFISTFANEVSS